MVELLKFAMESGWHFAGLTFLLILSGLILSVVLKEFKPIYFARVTQNIQGNTEYNEPDERS